MIRSIVSKAFNTNDPTPIDVIVEKHDSGAVVEYPKPTPRLVLSVDKRQFLADGVDKATLTVSFEKCSLVANELVWATVVPTGDVVFTVNLKPTSVAVNAAGQAIMPLQSTIEKRFQVRVSHSAYGEAYVNIEALI